MSLLYYGCWIHHEDVYRVLSFHESGRKSHSDDYVLDRWWENTEGWRIRKFHPVDRCNWPVLLWRMVRVKALAFHDLALGVFIKSLFKLLLLFFFSFFFLEFDAWVLYLNHFHLFPPPTSLVSFLLLLKFTISSSLNIGVCVCVFV